MAGLSRLASVFETPLFDVAEQRECATTTMRIVTRHVKQLGANVICGAGFKRDGVLHLLGRTALHEGRFNVFPSTPKNGGRKPVINEIEVGDQGVGGRYPAQDAREEMAL